MEVGYPRTSSGAWELLRATEPLWLCPMALPLRLDVPASHRVLPGRAGGAGPPGPGARGPAPWPAAQGERGGLPAPPNPLDPRS